MIEIKDIKKTYNLGKTNAFEALHGISMTIANGEMVAVMGTSGAGKSTLLHILACIDRYDSGEYIIDGELIGKVSERKMAEIRNSRIGMVMQDFALVEDFTAIENVIIPLDFSRKSNRKKKKEKRQVALEVLEAVGMQEFAGKPVKKLSGGQKQRIAIARAIVNRPDLLLADEPTGALDSVTTKEIMNVFRSLNKQGKTIVIVTHDKEVAEQCDRIVEISDGKIISV